MSPRAVALLTLLALPACDVLGLGTSRPTVIDGSSSEAFQRTVDQARAELGPRNRVQFDAALAAVRARRFVPVNDRARFEREVRETLDGQTAPEVIASIHESAARFRNEAADRANAQRELRNVAR